MRCTSREEGSMYLTGFADEAADDIQGQIEGTRRLGWENIEARNIDGRNIHDVPDEAFDRACAALQEAGVHVNCFGSTIANWGKQIDEPSDSSLAEAKRAIPRMQRLGTRLVRIMSFAVLKDRDPTDQMEEERFRRLRELCRMFGEAGLVPVHENCMNYGGMGASFTLRLLENVPGLKLVFDTGNPVFTEDRDQASPFPRQSSWNFYEQVRDHVEYVHIKDGTWDTETESPVFTFPGEGDGDVRKIVSDLLRRGYDGGISIEPHMKVVYHEGSAGSEKEGRIQTYVEYGRRMSAMIDEIRQDPDA